MEFIKGEELSSLLRRIGRLPTDKAIEIARQLCAGLAAAHDNHVLPRDLFMPEFAGLFMSSFVIAFVLTIPAAPVFYHPAA